MITWLAQVEPNDVEQLRPFCARWADQLEADVRAECVVAGVRVGIEGGTGLLSLATIRHVLSIAEALSGGIEFRLTWDFSSVAIPSTDIRALRERWDETDEPPLLSIIDLRMSTRHHITHGLAVFAGHELAVSFDEPERAREAAGALARLARHALMNGGLTRNLIYEGLDGKPLRLVWPDEPCSPAMVTMFL
jgi:hypothetical protein